jgi:hypothetical protein
VDLSLDNPVTPTGKVLKRVSLFRSTRSREELLMGVDEFVKGWACVARALFTAT